jgi:curved DNA-binding protein CbpA
LLLRIVAGEAEAEATAIALTGRSRDLIRQAAVFFVEQVLLCPNSDSYRVLGADPHASNGELRSHMGLLVRWLHPDKYPGEQGSVFVNKVTRAWDDLKTPERRASYDEGRRATSAQEHLRTSRHAVNSSRNRRRRRLSLRNSFRHRSLLGRAWLFVLRLARQ